ncbi:uncharacterized protein [Panulirus ornatus]|uniref:uncharacterized protein isoform X2 n=1 Tax=Panulirus ornatus TaxID=150431 RepID=UPI003A863E81
MATTLFPMPATPLHAAPPTHQTQDPPTQHAHDGDHGAHAARAGACRAHEGAGVDLGTLTGRRITLKPRRTLSLSPTPARTGDMSMGGNLRAARCLDFTDKDDDDGLYQPSDSDTEPVATKKKGEPEDEENNNTNNNNTGVGGGVKARHKRHTVNGIIGTSLASALGSNPGSGPGAGSALLRKTSGSVKRPLDAVLPCQEIQYLDINYQKVQYSPIPRKKIAYHHVPYNSIPYCEVPYCGTGERPIKRKPLQRSHSIAVADRREIEDCEWSSAYKLRDVLGTRLSSRSFKETWDAPDRSLSDALIFSSAEASG